MDYKEDPFENDDVKTIAKKINKKVDKLIEQTKMAKPDHQLQVC